MMLIAITVRCTGTALLSEARSGRSCDLGPTIRVQVGMSTVIEADTLPYPICRFLLEASLQRCIANCSAADLTWQLTPVNGQPIQVYGLNLIRLE